MKKLASISMYVETFRFLVLRGTIADMVKFRRRTLFRPLVCAQALLLRHNRIMKVGV